MINYREIFNVRYGYFFFSLIIILFLLLLIVNRDIKSSFKMVGNILFSSGIVCLVIVLLFNIVINFFVGDIYMLFVSVISDTLYENLLYRGIVNLFIGGILIFIYNYLNKKKNINFS